MSKTSPEYGSSEEIKARAQSEAQDYLRLYWDGQFPVDPVKIARNAGLTVKNADLDPNISGLIAKREGEVPEIFVNKHDNDRRARFTVAHELGHYADRPDDEEIGYVDYRAGNVGPAEEFANAFAACLLMPEDEIRNNEFALNSMGITDRHHRIAWHAKRLGVSTTAMSVRLAKLGI